MRHVFLPVLMLGFGLALAAAAQPAGAPTSVDGPSRNEQADAALAMSIHQREAAELRIARIACAAGDTAKCAVVKAHESSSPASTSGAGTTPGPAESGQGKPSTTATTASTASP